MAATRQWAVEQGIRIVLPMSESSAQLCNLERESWESAGMTVGCAPAEMLNEAFDKARTLTHASAVGLRTPAWRLPDSMESCYAAADEVGYPCVIKPRFSYFWNGASFAPNVGCAFAASRGDLETAVQSRRQGSAYPLIQQYVPGHGRGVFTLFNPDSAPLMWFQHRRIREVNPAGSAACVAQAVAPDPRLQAEAERLLRHMRWIGPAMVEFRDDGIHRPVLMEVNGRFWGSLQLAVDSGVDFPLHWICLLEGAATTPPRSYVADTTLRWLWGDMRRFLHVLAGPPPGYTQQYPTWKQAIRDLFGPQIAGTRQELFRRDDPWPALGEVVQLMHNFAKQGRRRRAADLNPLFRATRKA